MTDDDVRTLIRQKIKEAGTQGEFAASIGFSSTFIGEVLRGTRDISPRLLSALGLVRKTEVILQPEQRGD